MTNKKIKPLSRQPHKIHCVKSVCIRSCSGPHFLAFGLNPERYGLSLHIQSECVKMRIRTTPNTDTFYAVIDKQTEKICRLIFEVGI